MPNRIIKIALEKHLFPELGEYSQFRGEVPYGHDNKSRVDFVLSQSHSTAKNSELLFTENSRSIYLEVKNTTLAQGKLALFPDTETTRGQRHLRELMALLPESRAVMLYLINRGDCTGFAPGDGPDPVYGQLLRSSIALGLEVLPCRFEVTPEGIRCLGLAQCMF